MYDLAWDELEPKKQTASNAKPKLFYPFELVEDCYWSMKNFHIMPDEGGYLDQDRQLMRDIRVYGWWYSIARNKVQSEITARDEARKNQRG